MNVRAEYSIDRQTDDIVFIVDLNRGKMSVTNDAEAVVEEVVKNFGNKRIVYRDPDGRWDELQHNNGSFSGFKPYP